MPAWNDQIARSEWAEADRKKRVLELGFKPRRRQIYRLDWSNFANNWAPRPTVLLREPEHWPRKVIIVAPVHPLGDFRTGTLNFSEASARKWIMQGYEVGHQAAGDIFKGDSVERNSCRPCGNSETWA
jgi:hypothetical protein